MDFNLTGHFKDKLQEESFRKEQFEVSKVFYLLFPLFVGLANFSFGLVDHMRNYVFHPKLSYGAMLFLRFMIFASACLSVYFFEKKKNIKVYRQMQPIIRLFIGLMFLTSVLTAPGSSTLKISIFGMLICYFTMWSDHIEEVFFQSLIIISAAIINVIHLKPTINEISSNILLFTCCLLLLCYLRRNHNINERKLFSYRNDLKKSLEDQKRLFGIFAHDISNPLLTLKASISILQRKHFRKEYNEVDKYALKIDEQVSHLSNLVKNLKAWQGNNTLHNSRNLHYETFPFEQILSPTLDLITPMAEHKNIQIESSVYNFQIYSNLFAIETCFRNLLTNAVKFTPNKGRIEISSYLTGDHQVLKVLNSGSQLEPETIESINQLDPLSLKTKKGSQGESGTGYGLKACLELLQNSNATLKAENPTKSSVSFEIRIKKIN